MSESFENAWDGLSQAEARCEEADGHFRQVENPTPHQRAAHERQQATAVASIVGLRWVLEQGAPLREAADKWIQEAKDRFRKADAVFLDGARGSEEISIHETRQTHAAAAIAAACAQMEAVENAKRSMAAIEDVSRQAVAKVADNAVEALKEGSDEPTA